MIAESWHLHADEFRRPNDHGALGDSDLGAVNGGGDHLDRGRILPGRFVRRGAHAFTPVRLGITMVAVGSKT